jgi:hypothetical protein
VSQRAYLDRSHASDLETEGVLAVPGRVDSDSEVCDTVRTRHSLHRAVVNGGLHPLFLCAGLQGRCLISSTEARQIMRVSVFVLVYVFVFVYVHVYKYVHCVCVCVCVSVGADMY